MYSESVSINLSVRAGKIKGKKILYVKYDTMIFYLLFLNATAFCLSILAYNIIL